MEGVAILSMVVRTGLTGKVTFKQKPEEVKEQEGRQWRHVAKALRREGLGLLEVQPEAERTRRAGRPGGPLPEGISELRLASDVFSHGEPP